jgi:hypothetical protein
MGHSYPLQTLHAVLLTNGSNMVAHLLHVATALTIMVPIEGVAMVIDVMTTVIAAEMTTGAEMMIAMIVIVVINALTVFDAVMTAKVGHDVIVSQHHMSIPHVRYARNMVTLLVTAGGVALMTRMMVRRVQILHPMALTQIGILTLVPRIILPVS